MIIYGRNAVHEALRSGRRPVRDIWVTESAASEPWLAGVAGVTVHGADEIESRCASQDHQGVCADAGDFPYVDAGELLAKPDPLIVVLDQVQDPRNLGAVCRTAEAVGATGVVIPERRAAEVTPVAVKASAGATEWVPVARVRNVADFLAEAKKAGCWCYGAALGDGAVDYLEPDYSGGCVLVLGAEGSGIRPRVADSCDQLVTLPMRGSLDSLNISAAAAALLYAIAARRA
ncbi:MAG: 23S rRNA (guanosine(2251)-2'-O)-methyltransferase RlmB [Solirubrobacterales bacterium]